PRHPSSSRPLPPRLTPWLSPLSLPDALPIFPVLPPQELFGFRRIRNAEVLRVPLNPLAGAVSDVAEVVGLGNVAHRAGKRIEWEDRKSTRLNSSHQIISFAVFCFEKKNNVVH